MTYPKIPQSRKLPVWPREAIPAWSNPISRNYLIRRGLSKLESEYYDLHYAVEGKWFKRVIIPIYQNGVLVTIQGRGLDLIGPRYLTEGNRHLYCPLDNDWPERKLLVVEGPFDLYAVARVYPRVVATLGVELSQEQVAQLLRLPNLDEIGILFDKEALSQAHGLQLRLNPLIPTVVLELSNAKDPGDSSNEDLESLLVGWR